MTTLTVGLTPRMAEDVAKAANILDGGISHEEFAIRAMQLLLRSMFGSRQGRPVGYRQSKFSEAGQQMAAQRVAAQRRARVARARRA